VVRTCLLDVNVLVALHLPAAEHFDRVDAWFSKLGRGGFATCAITEAGFVRVLTQQSLYTPDPIRLSEARFSLGIFLQSRGHHFWPMDIGYMEATASFEERAYGHQQVTDSYLLGLAIHHKGVLATMDRKIPHIAGPEFAEYVEVIA
jgi:toxin-antitoxin system PIN domain toxin